MRDAATRRNDGPAVTRRCTGCHTQLAPALLGCPACGTLVHAAELTRIAADADAATAAGLAERATALWQEALALLPLESRQHALVSERIAALAPPQDVDEEAAGPVGTREVGEAVATVASAGPNRKWWGAIAVAATFLLSKGKLLLMGLTKLKTAASMLLFFVVDWQIFGWKYAAGLVLSIYVHEMGHVAALAHHGIRASAPMFIPGLGAFVRLHQPVTDPRVDARVGLAGPLWGLGAALVAYGLYLGTGIGAFAAIARGGAFINLFNLIPFWQLDGGRGFSALSRGQRWIAVAMLAATWALTREGLLVLLGIAAVWQAYRTPPTPAGETPRGDVEALGTYVALVAALLWLMNVHVPAGAIR